MNVPRFLVVTSQDKDRKVSDLSPLVIEKSIQSIAGHPKSIKRLNSGGLLLEVEKNAHVTALLATKKLFDLKVKISLHNTLNTSKGVIRCQDLGPCTDNEILDNVMSEGVIHVRNIQVRRNGALKRTNTYVLTFNTPVLPKKIKAAYLSVNVEVYIPNPLRCYHCQVFSYHEENCTKKPICGNCGGESHCNSKESSKCANCSDPRPGFSHNCPTWKKEKEILSVKYKRTITCFDARKIVKEQLSAPANSYASITKGAGKHVECIDTQTQTDETYNVQLLDRNQVVVRPLHTKQMQEANHALHQPQSTSLFKEGANASSSGQSKPTDQKNAPKLKLIVELPFFTPTSLPFFDVVAIDVM